MANHPLNPSGPSVRDHLHEIVFEADTPAGKAFDVLLILSILGSVIVVMLDSVETIHARSGVWLTRLEWTFTILFTVEYVVRLASVRRPWGYALSFFGVIDLLAIIPTYLSLVVAGTQSLLVIRILRLLRVFRVFKLGYYLSEARVLKTAMQASRAKITVFLTLVMSIVVVMGALLYLIEGEASGFTSIPRGMYWASGHHDHGWLRRHRTDYGARPDCGRWADGARLRHHRGPDRYRVGGAGAGRQPSTGVDAGLSRLQRRGPRCRRRLLQVLRRAPLSRHGVEVAGRGIPAGGVASSVTDRLSAPSSRLASRAPRSGNRSSARRATMRAPRPRSGALGVPT